MGNNSKVGGILSIVSGAFGVLSLGWFVLWIYMFNFMISAVPQDPFAPPFPQELFQFFAIIYGFMGLILALLGVLAIVGGVFALKRKYWGLALAGAIASIITFFPCGIAAIIFISLGRQEFLPPEPSTPAN